MDKMLFFVATEKGYSVLKRVFGYDSSLIGLVCTFNETNVQESYSDKIKEFCFENHLNFIPWNELKNTLISNINRFKITCAVAIGWRYLIPLEINEHMKTGLIVFHDSLLPKYRGFAPTPTAILCGEKEIGMSVLFATDEIDKGAIILQKKFPLPMDMYIQDAIHMQSRLYCEAIIELIEMIKNNNLKYVFQDESLATYSVWRDPDDCRIDWGLSNIEIYNLIRAVSYPYSGAFTYYEGKKVFVWKAELIEDLKFEKRDAGKIWSIDKCGNPAVICGEGMLKLLDVTFENREKVDFNNIRRRFG